MESFNPLGALLADAEPGARADCLAASLRATFLASRSALTLGLFRSIEMNAADHFKFKRAYGITTNDATLGPDRAQAFMNTRRVAAMLMKIRSFPDIFACMLALASIAQASAGEVKLVSDTMDMICRVEVTSGPDAPNAPVETYTDVKKDWSITKPDKLCYRRASTPHNCDSGMTQWNTQWKCAAKPDSGIEELSLK